MIKSNTAQIDTARHYYSIFHCNFIPVTFFLCNSDDRVHESNGMVCLIVVWKKHYMENSLADLERNSFSIY